MQATPVTSSSHKLKGGIDLQRVEAVVGPILVAHGVELVDLEWVGGPAGPTLRVTIERTGAEAAEGSGAGVSEAGEVLSGVTLHDCAEVSRDLSAALDVEEPIRVHYHLEVSSPGLDRPLKKLRDYHRFAGKLAKIKLRRPLPDGQRVLRGRLLTAAPEHDASGDDALRPGDTARAGDTTPAGEEEQFGIEVDGKTFGVALSDVDNAHLVFELETQKKGSSRSRSTPNATTPRSKSQRGRPHRRN
jgi:ribosome maturation factor RimP